MPIANRSQVPAQGHTAPAPPSLPRYAASHYYGENNETPVPDVGNTMARGGGVYGAPRRQLKGRWPDEDENGQVIDNRTARDGRGGYDQENNREGHRQQGNNYSQQGNNYGQQGDRGGYYHENGEYSQRGDREFYNPESSRGEYRERSDRGGHNLENRGEYFQRSDRGNYTPENSRGGYAQRSDRSGYLAQERRINEAWPVLGEARGGGGGGGGGGGRGGGYPNNFGRSQDPGQMNPWGGNNNICRPLGNGQTRGGPAAGRDRGQFNSFGGRGRGVARAAPSYTHYR